MPVGVWRPARALAQAGALASLALAVHTAFNIRQLDRLQGEPGPEIREKVSVLIPARNEAHRLGPVVAALLTQRGIPSLEILILDDGSVDDTLGVARAAAGDDPRVRIVSASDDVLPAGWLGKPWACHRLSQMATGSVFVFLDADVLLQEWSIHSAVAYLRGSALELVSPYPRQVAGSIAERVTQPLVNWSWMATMPTSAARSSSPAFSAAIGQFLVVDAHAYRVSGGHVSVRDFVVEDVEVLRSMKRAGFRGMPVNGSNLATCRMYVGASEVFDGYTKSLWSVFGTTAGAIGGVSAMVLIYVLPSALMMSSRDRVARRWGVLGYLSGVTSRALTAGVTGERVMPDALAHPLSIGAFAGMTLASIVRHRRGALTWKGRVIH